MATRTNKNKQQVQQPAGSVAQQLAKIRSNGHQMPGLTNAQQGFMKQSKQKVNGKALREWLNVSGIILIPLMLGIFTINSNIQQNNIALGNRKADIQRQEDQQKENILDTYIHDMSDLIFTKGLRISKPGDEVRVTARAETLITLRQLDGARKGIAMQFLYEAELIINLDNKDVIIRRTTMPDGLKHV